MVFAHPPASLSPFVKGTRQERIQVFGYSVVEVHDEDLIVPSMCRQRESRFDTLFREIFKNFPKIF